jgi:hypothetical protein
MPPYPAFGSVLPLIAIRCKGYTEEETFTGVVQAPDLVDLYRSAEYTDRSLRSG